MEGIYYACTDERWEMSKPITKELLEDYKRYFMLLIYGKSGSACKVTPKDVFEPELFPCEYNSFEEINEHLSKSIVIRDYLEYVFAGSFAFWCGEEDVEECLNNMFEVIAKKNHDYGSDNIPDMGLLGIYQMIDNKINRITTLANADEINFESMEDSYFDLASYALLGLLLCNGALSED